MTKKKKVDNQTPPEATGDTVVSTDAAPPEPVLKTKLGGGRLGGFKARVAERPVPDDLGEEGKAHEDTDWLDEGFLDPESLATKPDDAKLPGKLTDMPLVQIRANTWNPNKMSNKTFDLLVRRLREAGCPQPIVVWHDPADGMYEVVDGFHRFKAAGVLGWETIPTIVLEGARWDDRDLRIFMGMTLNNVHGQNDPVEFIKLYNHLLPKYPDKELQDLMGFAERTKWKILTKGIADGLPAGMKKKFGERVKDASADELGGILAELMAHYGNDLRYNFMVFTLDGIDNVWVRCNPDTMQVIAQLAERCRTSGTDINYPLLDGLNVALNNFTTAPTGTDGAEPE
jgi:hypothetical protein